MAAYYNEIDPQKAAWLRELVARNLIAPGDVDERSIADVRPDNLRGYRQCHFFAGIGTWSYALRLARWPDDREVWTGSCPCQPFSAAGQRKAFDDDRHLWPAWFRLIEGRRPVVCFGEQVSSIDGLAWFDVVRADLDGAGYACGVLDTCAAGVGAPHRRQRLYWVADHDRSGSLESLQRRKRESRDFKESSWNSSLDAERRAGESERFCDVGGLEDAVCAERRPDQREQDGYREASGWDEGADRAGERGAVNGFWRDADWVLTRPQRVGERAGLRPVEPGSFPLAHGAPARVGRLRGYGDSIVAPVAQAFIEAYMAISR